MPLASSSFDASLAYRFYCRGRCRELVTGQPSLWRRAGLGEQDKRTYIAQDVPNVENRHIRLVGQPVTLSRTPSKMAARPPEFGEQTDEVLAEFGFRANEIVALKKGKVV